MIRLWFAPLIFVLGASLSVVIWLRDPMVLTNLRHLMHPSITKQQMPTLACPDRPIITSTGSTTENAPAEFTRQVLATLTDCDPDRRYHLSVHSTFRPSQVFVPGFPSQSELNADRRLRSLVTALTDQGYHPAQIERFHFQSRRNGLSVKIKPMNHQPNQQVSR